MAKLESLIVDIQANTAKLQQGLDAANARLKTFDDAVSQFKGLFVFSKIGSAALSAAEKLGAFVAKGIESIDAIAKQATLYGETAEQFSRLSYAFSQGGVDAEQFGKMTQHLSDNLSKAAAGSKEQVALFQAFGVAAVDASGNVRKTSDVIKDLATKFAGLADGPAKAQLAVELFGKGGEKMVETLSKGAEGIAELEAQADKFGATVTGSAAAAADKFNDTLDKMAAGTDALGRNLAAKILPALNVFVEKVTQSETLTTLFSKGVELIGDAMKYSVIGITVAVAGLDKFLSTIGRLAEAFALLTSGSFSAAKDKALEARDAYAEMGRAMKDAAREASATWTKPITANATGTDATKIVKAAKAAADAIDAQKKHTQEAAAALKELTKVAEDYEMKVSTFGSSDPVAELQYRLEKGDLADKLALLGDKAGAMKDRILEAAKALADLNDRKFEVALEFNIDAQMNARDKQMSQQDDARFAQRYGQDALNKKLAAGFASFDAAQAEFISQMNKSYEYAADAARAAKDGNQQAEHHYKELQRYAEDAAENADKAAQAYADLEQSARATLSKVAKGIGGVMSGFVSKLGDLGDVLQAGIQGFQQGGPWVALFAVIMELFSKFKGFGEIINIANAQLGQFIEMLSPAFEMLATAFKAIMEFSGTLTQIIIRVLSPIIEIVSRVLTKLFTALQPILNVVNMVVEVLSPIFDAFMALVDALDPFQFAVKVIAIVFNVVGLVLLAIARVVVGIAQGVLYIVKGISDLFGGNKDIDKAFNSVNATAKNIEDKMKDLAQNIGNPDAIGSGNPETPVDTVNLDAGHIDASGIDSLNDSASGAANAINDFSNSLTNVPQGFRYAAAAYNAQGLSSEAVFGSGREDITLMIDGEKLAQILGRRQRKTGFRKTGRKGDELP